MLFTCTRNNILYSYIYNINKIVGSYDDGIITCYIAFTIFTPVYWSRRTSVFGYRAQCRREIATTEATGRRPRPRQSIIYIYNRNRWSVFSLLKILGEINAHARRITCFCCATSASSVDICSVSGRSPNPYYIYLSSVGIVTVAVV